jgi:predicted ATPase
MLVTFKNTGMIEAADIRVDGLTVIAGENDTGKSTVGKLMFSIIKTFNRYERDARLYQVRNIQRVIDDYYFGFRKKYDNETVLDAGRSFFDRLKDEALKLIDKSLPLNEIRTAVSDMVTSFIETVQRVSDTEIILEDIPASLAPLIGNKPSPEDVYKRTLRNYMVSLFDDEVANKFAEKPEFSIVGKEGNVNIFEITGTTDSPAIHLSDRLYFDDATFIESPMVVNLVDTIRFSKTEFDRNGESKTQAELLEKSYAPEYMKDLLLKLTDQPTRGKPSIIADQIRDIIGGDFYYDPEEREFVFEKGKQTFKGLSIASGIKYMGIVNILSQAGFLNKKALLVLDEPETHIHPQWQIRFAELLVKLIMEGGNILLCSHSPYMIEAVKVFSDKNQAKEKTAFYLGKKTKTTFTSRIRQVTNDITPIFESLVEPYDKLEIIQAEGIA